MGAKSRKLLSPVSGGLVSSRFGTRTNPITKRKEHHNGIDIAIREGSHVLAIDSGKVTNVFKSDVGGNQLIIKHDSGMISGYAHLQAAIVKAGDRVERGELIALSGRSGQTTGAHLHLSLRDKTGKYIDPESRLSLS
jgi:murein DD-endopeptidase MepM/ murein hydrolase activator NlpD